MGFQALFWKSLEELTSPDITRLVRHATGSSVVPPYMYVKLVEVGNAATGVYAQACNNGELEPSPPQPPTARARDHHPAVRHCRAHDDEGAPQTPRSFARGYAAKRSYPLRSRH